MFPIRDNVPSRTTPFINNLLIAACVLVFLVQLHHTRRGEDPLAERFGMIPLRIVYPDAVIQVPELRQVRTFFGVEEVRTFHKFKPLPFSPLWTFLTSIFLHGGFLHLVGNMWFLFIFGDNVEDRLGHGRYLLFYLLCGVAGNLAHFLVNIRFPEEAALPVIGASGAIAGVMGAYFLLYPHARVLTLIPIFIFPLFTAIPAPVFLAIWFLLQFFQGVMSITPVQTAGVAVWSHIGGFITGLALALWLQVGGRLRPPVRERMLRPW